MDYKTIYDDSYKTMYEMEEKKIKDKLILGAQKFLYFHEVAGTLITTHDETIKENIIYQNTYLSTLEKKFTKELNRYSNKPILDVLENYLKNLYAEIDFKELPTNYSYHLFVIDLASLHAKNEVFYLFKEQDSLYKMMYLLKDFTDFEIKRYDMTLVVTPIYNKLHSKLYPPKQKVHPLKNITQNDNSSEPQLETKKLKLYETINFNISKFSDDEKIFLLHVYKSTKIKIPWTEYAKLMIITSGLKDSSIFEEGSVNNRFYDKLYKGIEYYGQSTQRDFIKRITEKMEPFGLSNINKAISVIKISIK